MAVNLSPLRELPDRWREQADRYERDAALVQADAVLRRLASSAGGTRSEEREVRCGLPGAGSSGGGSGVAVVTLFNRFRRKGTGPGAVAPPRHPSLGTLQEREARMHWAARPPKRSATGSKMTSA